MVSILKELTEIYKYKLQNNVVRATTEIFLRTYGSKRLLTQLG